MSARKKKAGADGMLSLRFWVAAIHELGIPSFIVLFYTMMFLFFGTKAQKKAFIDRFFLFEDVSQNPFPFAFVLITFWLVIVFQYVYYNKIIQIKEEEKRRIAADRAELQKLLLNGRTGTG